MGRFGSRSPLTAYLSDVPTVVRLSPDRLHRLLHGAVAVAERPALFRIAGSGALDCLQGLLTNDLVKPGADRLVYGALLTQKGMILSDAWVIRRRDEFLWISPRSRREETLALFTRSLPPRLARVRDESDRLAVITAHGPRAVASVQSAFDSVPTDPGQLTEVTSGHGPVLLARPHDTAPFRLLLVAAQDEVPDLLERMARAGIPAGDEVDGEGARILAGWPAIGAEIDDRTLPQEVRYDEIDAVSYSKGCYVGQETVARIHFRGHPNRELRGLVWPGESPSGAAVQGAEGREGGVVSSVLALPGRSLGLVKIRREILESGTTEVSAGGAPARLVTLPFAPDEIAA
jgi:folate-binding protein YgfZ